MVELTCENCFWFSPHYEIHGRCRNPRNATVGSAGSDYSSSDLLKPMDTKIFMVCDLHEAPATSNVRKVYDVKGVTKLRTIGSSGYNGYDTEWVRVPPLKPL